MVKPKALLPDQVKHGSGETVKEMQGMCNAMLDENEMDRLPFGRTDFSAIRRDGNIYADKTEMVRRLARIKGAPVFLTRPRRFSI